MPSIESNVAEALDLELSYFNEEVRLHGLYPAYQALVTQLSIFPKGHNYEALGLNDEFWEAYESRGSLREWGDFLWYCMALCNQFNIPAQDVFGSYVPSVQQDFWTMGKLIGEIQGHCKKITRDHDNQYTPERRQAVCQALRQLIGQVDRNLKNSNHSEGIVVAIWDNADKLLDRQVRGKLKGDGDYR